MNYTVETLQQRLCNSKYNYCQVGPPLGGFLYAAGGFFLPFVVMGSLTLLMAGFIIAGMPNEPESSKRTRHYSLYAYVESVSFLGRLAG